MQGCMFSFTVVIPVLAELGLADFQENAQARLGRRHKPGTVFSKQPECTHSVFKDKRV